MSEQIKSEVELDALVDQVRNDAFLDVSHYSVPILLDQKFHGSGTLARVGEHHGIITAEHVINHPFDGAFSLVGLNAKVRELHTSLGGGRVAKVSFKKEHLRFVIPRRAFRSHSRMLLRGTGPDLAFICLPIGSDGLAYLKATKSFISFDRAPESRLGEAKIDTGALVFTGFPEQFVGRNITKRGDIELLDLNVALCIAATKRAFARKGWDYFDISVDLSKIPQIKEQKKTFGGVSGGGCWRLIVEGVGGSNEEYQARPVFAGVSFREIRRGRECVIRVHGAESVYHRLIPAIRRALE